MDCSSQIPNRQISRCAKIVATICKVPTLLLQHGHAAVLAIVISGAGWLGMASVDIAFGQEAKALMEYERRAWNAIAKENLVEAERILRQGLQVAERIGRPTIEQASLQKSLGSVLLFQDKPDLAENEMRKAIDLVIASAQEKSILHSYCLSELSLILQRRQKFDEAERVLKQALELAEGDSGRVADCLESLANLYKEQRQYTEAEKCLVRALNSYRGSGRRNADDELDCLRKLVILYQQQEKYAEAEQLILEMLASERKKKTLGTNSTELRLMQMLASQYYQQFRFTDAEKLYLQLLNLLSEEGSQDEEQVRSVEAGLARTYQGLGNYADSRELYYRVVKTTPRRDMHDPILANLYRESLGEVCLAEKRFAEAELHFRAALDAHRKKWPDDWGPQACLLSRQLATVFSILGRSKEADDLYAKSIKGIVKGINGSERIDLHERANRTIVEAKRLVEQQRLAEADAHYRVAFHACEVTYGPLSAQCGQMYELIAENLVKQSRPEEAAVYKQRAASIRKTAVKR